MIDPFLVQRLAEIGCTDEEIGAVVGCSRRTIRRRYGRLVRQARAHGKVSLRRHLLRLVEAGSVEATIFLAKVELGMRERTTVDVEVEHVEHVHIVPVPRGELSP
jgi:hypothetical protein